MEKLTVTCLFKEGVHARPASELVKLCQPAKSNIVIKKNESEGNPKSILSLMSLGIGYNDTFTVEVSGEDENIVASSIKTFFEQE